MSISLEWESNTQGRACDAESSQVVPFYTWQNADTVFLWLGGQIYQYAKASAQSTRRDVQAQFRDTLAAPMPGTVLKILVAENDTVAAQTPMIILESMKMEMTLTAPTACKVREIKAKVGQLVNMHETLMTLAPDTLEATASEPA